MANLTTGADLLADLLFRAGEPTDGSSDWHQQAIVYLNRAWRAVYMGGAEIAPGQNEAWWWLRAPTPGTLDLRPPIAVELDVVEGSRNAAFLSDPMVNATGWHLSVPDLTGDVYRIQSHTVATLPLVLDAAWTGATASAANGTIAQLEHDLSPECLRIQAPMRARDGRALDLMDLSAMLSRWPIWYCGTVVPDAFAYVGETRIRVNALPTERMRLEYDWLVRPGEITPDLSEPILPPIYRHLIPDLGLYFLWVDKNDNRADQAGLLCKAGLKAMQLEHRHRMLVASNKFGRIQHRAESRYDARIWAWGVLP